MTAIAETLTIDHRRCDDIFADAEAAVAKSDWQHGDPVFKEFSQALEHHFEMEESVLFPGFEERTGQTMGPTQMMRQEHIQMRALLGEMGQAVALRDRERYLGLAETLMMIMQQHNMKEEQILYRMIDQAFGDEALGLVERMREI
ncbi:MAG: hemerythrin HHE cation-binding protein [Candidatus Sedimenticola endophacoides]|uniref:Hemerythrin HHE cation-binding protein n=1 Tax=Candidatus Sedimenticola endophacoides TaxID=2548426 RepID=A0A657PUQ3_9GAMM|nr:MAG: hemerythrin HHE cation-binding protein [Candidatus Sedimenticola endophacoides]OQX36225.1 MAG: hemerythrin HHE cation-binding protein [Candidatus Sedimenticola endophacoides]OQX40058.1 MAG: hemerythrin HHE cation-binding protein [Candidatus Sedimenticola endophacoides]OQX44190.1 MAG: hemerythrin HHE cation-binding protein [Candidatus Sedimenticola endophacoides]OQX48244.1 MAG: hemerythrin HHE cation-binding protein [Candidatus Sedimenticola endophacoides]